MAHHRASFDFANLTLKMCGDGLYNPGDEPTEKKKVVYAKKKKPVRAAFKMKSCTRVRTRGPN